MCIEKPFENALYLSSLWSDLSIWYSDKNIFGKYIQIWTFLTPFLNKLQLSDKESAGFGKIVRVQIIRSAVAVFFSIVHPAIQTESKSDKDDISLLQKEPPV